MIARTGAEGWTDPRNLVDHVVDVAEQVLDRVDHVLEHRLNLVVLVIVGKTVVRTELVKDGLEAEEIGVEAVQLRGAFGIVVAATGRGRLMRESACEEVGMSLRSSRRSQTTYGISTRAGSCLGSSYSGCSSC